ncbi:spore germination protein [Alteribacter natronophilus]|uniref:spore germination protein n=1 Tax=Alteribacter natronophilus TaxID=2583810 RepID=UPI00110DA5DC|nr:spore germination protein [Alteribacter natronophilus]TMW73904.1 spore germination protein [Alteribacter natronophilus]
MGLFKAFKHTKNSAKKGQKQEQLVEPPDIPTFPVSFDMNKNRRYIKETLYYTEDLVEKSLRTELPGTCHLFYIETMSDTDKLNSYLYQKLRDIDSEVKLERMLQDMDSAKMVHLSDAVSELLSGKSILLLEGKGHCYILSTNSVVKRDIGEPDNEQVIRGSHSGFIENIGVNIQLIRNLISHPTLQVNYTTLGELSQTKTAMMYMEGRADPEVVDEIQRRLKKIKVDQLLNNGVLEEYLEDNIYSLFPQFISTERADRAALNLLDGRILILTDGDPTVLVLPVTFFSFFQSTDDYNSRWAAGNFFRLIRVISFLLAVTLPGIYIAIISFHFEIIPFGMTYVIKDAVEHIPYPPLVEAMIMELTLELIREAGIRLPTPIGQTIGIVGGLVIGDAVVNAGFISSIMIIVVALTAISSFVVPVHEMSMAMRLLRYPIMIMASMLGFLGIVFCLSLYLIHLCKLTSIGQPFFYPFAPLNAKGLLNRFIRLPHTVYVENSPKKKGKGQSQKS